MRHLPLALVLVLCACGVPTPPPDASPAPLPDLPPADGATRRMVLAVTVPDAAKAAADIEAALKGLGGYVTNRDIPVAAGGTSRSVLLSLSVDSKQATALADRIKSLGTPTGEKTASENITEEMTTVNARLAGLRDVEARMRDWEAGADRNCAKVGALEAERVKVVDQIATLVAHQRAVDSRSHYAAAVIRLDEPPPPAPPSFVDDVRRTAGRILSSPGDAARDAAVVALAWLPAIVLVMLGLRGISRRRRGQAPRRPEGPPAA